MDMPETSCSKQMFQHGYFGFVLLCIISFFSFLCCFLKKIFSGMSSAQSIFRSKKPASTLRPSSAKISATTPPSSARSWTRKRPTGSAAKRPPCRCAARRRSAIASPGRDAWWRPPTTGAGYASTRLSGRMFFHCP